MNRRSAGSFRKARWRDPSGFTVAEVLVTLVFGMMVVAMSLAFQRVHFFALQHQAQQIDLQSTTRSVIDLLAREIRMAGFNANAAFCGIAEARPHVLHIQADLDGDGALAAANEDLTYVFDPAGGRLLRNDRAAGGGPETLLDDVDEVDFEFRYFDAAGVEIVPSGSLTAAQRSAVRLVRVRLSLENDTLDPSNDSDLHADGATNIDVRNRFFAGSIAAPVCS